MTGTDPIGAEFESLQRAGTHVGDQHVGGREQPVEDGVVVEVTQIEHHRTLAAVVDLERRDRHRPVEADRSEHAALRIAGGRFDLDDVGPPVGHDAARRGSRDPHAEFDDPNPGERPRTRRTRCVPRVGHQPSAAITSGGAWTSSIRTPSPLRGVSSLPFGWMKHTSWPGRALADAARREPHALRGQPVDARREVVDPHTDVVEGRHVHLG